MIGQLTVVGLGLIGGSFACSARQFCDTIVGFDQNRESLRRAKERDVIDISATSLAAAVVDAEMIFISVPMLATEEILKGIKAALWTDAEPEGLIVTDAGSVKSHFLEVARNVFGELPTCLVPGHPIAGSERHGIDAAEAGLFVGHKVILTPHDRTDVGAQGKVESMWQGAGAEVICMSATHHDELLAETSHLPHLLAYALVDTLSSEGDRLEIFKYAAGGFRDFTRIAASDPVMWSDIFHTNADAVVQILDRFIENLLGLREAIAAGDRALLKSTFERAKSARDYFTSLGESK